MVAIINLNATCMTVYKNVNQVLAPVDALLLLGQRIGQERLRQNLTQQALARLAGVAYSTLRKIESTGIGAMSHYAAILLALGQLDQLAAWAVAGSNADSNTGTFARPADALALPRKRARSPRRHLTAPASVPALVSAPEPVQTITKTAGAMASPALQLAEAASQPVRKSARLGLDLPYDWSNPDISDAALIGNVLDRARFMDVSRVFAHYGFERVSQVAQDLNINLTTGVLGTLMPGIRQGAQRV